MKAIPRRMSPRSKSLAFTFLSLKMRTPQIKDMITELRRTRDTTEIMESASFSDVKYAKSPMQMKMEISGIAQLQWKGVV